MTALNSIPVPSFMVCGILVSQLHELCLVSKRGGKVTEGEGEGEKLKD